MWDDTESQATTEEHHQLPPYENVPEGRRSQEERRKTWLEWNGICRVFFRWDRLNGGEGKKHLLSEFGYFFIWYAKW